MAKYGKTAKSEVKKAIHKTKRGKQKSRQRQGEEPQAGDPPSACRRRRKKGGQGATQEEKRRASPSLRFEMRTKAMLRRTAVFGPSKRGFDLRSALLFIRRPVPLNFGFEVAQARPVQLAC